jgi:hypothetical protein
MLRRTSIVVALIGAAVIAGHAQRGRFVQNVGLTPLNVGEVLDTSRAPGSPASRAKSIVEAAIRDDGRIGATRSAVPGRVIVRFRASATAAARTAAVRAVSRTGAIAQRPSYADFDLIRIDAADDPELIAAALKAQHADTVENAQAAYRLKPMFRPNDPLYATRQWNLPYLNLEPAWDIQPSAGSDIIVAVLDSGMAYRSALITTSIPGFTDGGQDYPPLNNVTIPFAAANQLVNTSNANRIVSPHDFVWDDDVPLDFDGHGTHIAGTIGQITNDNTGPAGVAFNVRLMPLKVLNGAWDDLLGSPYFATDDLVAIAIRYAADHGAKILNMSFGRSVGGPAFVIEDAIRYAVGRGAFVAISAGNEYQEGNPVSWLAEICPRINGAMSVAAIDRNRGHASYSTAGPYVEIGAWRRSSDRRLCAGRRPDRAADVRFHVHGHLSATALAIWTAPIRRLRLPGIWWNVDGDGARRRRRSDPDAARHHQPGGDRRRAAADRRRSRHAWARQLLRLRASQRPQRHVRDRSSQVRTAILALFLISWSTAVSAQNAPAVALRPYFELSRQKFSADHTFENVFGETSASFWGAGLQVVFWESRIYAETGLSRLTASPLEGERVFVSGNSVFKLGIPLRSTIKPWKVAGGYRFHLSPLVIPYAGAGFASYSYSEESDFAAAAENFEADGTGALYQFGVEVRVHRWVGVTVGAERTSVTGILGNGGLSGLYTSGGLDGGRDGEDDLGGWAFQFRVVVGR